jgi:hypothetical protein
MNEEQNEQIRKKRTYDVAWQLEVAKILPGQYDGHFILLL